MVISEPNPPLWSQLSNSVLVCTPDMTPRQVESMFYATTGLLNNRKTGHFSDRRVAVLFHPGSDYKVNLAVGYYTQVLGLGENADDVVFTGDRGVYAEAMDYLGAGSLDTFWRGAENFKTEATGYRSRESDNFIPGMMWAVSQAAPLRRIVVEHGLNLHEEGKYASGGFMANMQVKKATNMGSQQQWMTRAVAFNNNGEAFNGAWSFVYVGCSGAPKPQQLTAIPYGQPGYTGMPNNAATNVVDASPVSAENPFISVKAGLYYLNVPKVQFNKTCADPATYTGTSPDLKFNAALIDQRPFSNVRVVGANFTPLQIPNQPPSEFGTWTHDAHQTVQDALDSGKDVILSPGIYKFGKSLVIKTPNQVLLGIGMATLMAPLDGTPCIKVAAGVGGVRVAGVTLQASLLNEGAYENSTLLEWGDSSAPDKGDPANPGFLFDVFARVGGPDIIDPANPVSPSCHTIMRINSGHVVGDDLWLWRADHSRLAPDETPEPILWPKIDGKAPGTFAEYHLVRKPDFMTETCLEVRADNVTIYGLAAEHALGHLVKWSGNDGKVFFFQSELPYDVDQASYGDAGIYGYKVDQTVTKHRGVGIGIYSYFRDHEVLVAAGIQAPIAPEVIFENPFTIFLTGNPGITSVIKGYDDAALMGHNASATGPVVTGTLHANGAITGVKRRAEDDPSMSH